MVDPALHGYGIAYLPEGLVARHVQSGELTLVLDEWSPSFAGYFIYYPSRRQTLRPSRSSSTRSGTVTA